MEEDAFARTIDPLAPRQSRVVVVASAMVASRAGCTTSPAEAAEDGAGGGGGFINTAVSESAGLSGEGHTMPTVGIRTGGPAMRFLRDMSGTKRCEVSQTL